MNANRPTPEIPHTALSRRQCLEAAAGVCLGACAFGTLGAAEEDPRAKAGKNLQLGIEAGVYSALPLEEAVRRIKADGFSAVLTAFNFADARFDPLEPDWKTADRIRDAFEKAGIRIASLYGYYNVVDPDPGKRKRGEARMEFLLANWKRLGCPVVSTETGTLNRQSEWLDAPENATEEGYAQCRAAFEKMARAAEKSGATVAIEAYWRNIIDSVDRAARLFRDVNSPALKLVMDPCNFFRKQDLARQQQILEDMFKRLGDRVAVAHAKDVKPSADGTDLPAPGLGVLDYPLYLRLLARLDRPMPLLIEHLALPDVPRARDFVLAQMGKV